MLILLALLAAGAPARTFRVDYVHVGTASEERFALERLVLEPLPWPGNPDRPIDDTDSGKYLFEVRDRATGRLLYSRGFSSIFGEWETTAEAKQVPRAFSESLRFPAPAAPVQIVPRERGKFEKDARRLMEVLFSTSPFKERREDFNVWGLCPPAAQSGISRPSLGIHRRSPAGATYDAFGSERYILTFDNRAFRDLAAHAPYELVEIVANARTYGGGGIFNLYGT